MGVSSSPLTYLERRKVLDALSQMVKEHFYDRHFSESEWPSIMLRHRESVLNASSDEDFELRIMKLLTELKSSHVGFYHSKLSRSSAKMALCATYSAFPVRGEDHWVFQDVHEGGPAARAGIRPGDVLVAVDDRRFDPPEHPMFPVSRDVVVSVLSSGLHAKDLKVTVPEPLRKKNQLPYVQPVPIVSSRKLASDTGYLRVAMYPGEIGVDIANDIAAAIQQLDGPGRLIVDLRGNTGGGAGFLRILSLLTPAQVPVGKFRNGTLTRTETFEKSAFVFDRIPSSKPGMYRLAARFLRALLIAKLTRRRLTITIMTEGLGVQPFHGRVVLLVDRHTASANEMLISFAKEHRLAVIVGEATPGRVLAGSKFKLPRDYWLALPIGSFQTDRGGQIEGQPIEPNVLVSFDPESAREGRDMQLERAQEIVGSL